VGDDLTARVLALPAQVNGDAKLQRIGRFCTTSFMLEAGAQSFHLRTQRGRLDEVVQGPRPLRAWVFALRAERGVWRRFWEPVPAPGFNDIFAMSRYGHMQIEGDMGPLLQHLWYLKEVLALPRRAGREDTV
jgi:hypothetical protein